MELTPQTMREVEFREKLRGYHPDDVDDFLEEVAVAVEELLARLEAAEQGRPTTAVAVAPPPPVFASVAPPVPATPTFEAPVPRDEPRQDPQKDLSNETLQRTLVLAQRTADLAIAEAENSARQIIEKAKEEAAKVKADAENSSSTMTRDAKARADAMIGELEARRTALEAEIATLQTWAVSHRDRLHDALTDQLRSLDAWLAANPPLRKIRTPPQLGTASALAARRAARPARPALGGAVDASPRTLRSSSLPSRPGAPRFGGTEPPPAAPDVEMSRDEKPETEDARPASADADDGGVRGRTFRRR